MLPESIIREQLAQHEISLSDWCEPGGLLVPTEPDPEERARVRLRLEGAIYALKWVLGEIVATSCRPRAPVVEPIQAPEAIGAILERTGPVGRLVPRDLPAKASTPLEDES